MLTIYRVMPTRKAVDSFLNRTGNLLPMLDEDNGDNCYDNREAAIKCATLVTRNLKAPRDFAIVHITYENPLHEELAFSGDINGTGEDFVGGRYWKLTGKASARLNREAAITMEVVSVPEYKPSVC